MTVMNVKQAEKQIRRQLSRASDPIGSEDRPFLDVFFQGRRPTAAEIDHCRQALRNLENRQQAYIVRGQSGEALSVDRYDCSRAVTEEVLPQLSGPELLLVMHRLLLEMVDDDGIVYSGRSKDEFVQYLTDCLKSDYDVSSKQVDDVYRAMVGIGLRGEHQARSGTEIYPIRLDAGDGSQAATSDSARLTHDLDQAEGKIVDLEGEVERLRGLTGELYRLGQAANRTVSELQVKLDDSLASNQRLTQSNADLRRGKCEQLEAIRLAQGALEQITKDT